MKIHPSGITIIDEYVKFNINRRQPYSVHQSELSRDITVHYPPQQLVEDAPIFENISWLIFHILTSKIVEGNIIELLKQKSIELYPESNINWIATDNFVRYHTEFYKRYSERLTPSNSEYENLNERSEERDVLRKQIAAELKAENNL